DVLWVNQAKRDHFDFVTKMRERGVEVLEMHNLLPSDRRPGALSRQGHKRWRATLHLPVQ
ncbi:arginine deiminase family protein, partial [Acinetobacter baumannii]|uniref:arginine deiminase family protein n=1 Tax=Acinetobacter baumannii TaxID=470 RepID=UPI001D174A40